MTHQCTHCRALRWKSEKTLAMCCKKGRVVLPEVEPYPEPLESLIQGTPLQSPIFFQNLRRLNCCTSFASFGGKEHRIGGPGVQAFKVQGQVFHRYGSFQPGEGYEAKNMQCYIYDVNTHTSLLEGQWESDLRIGIMTMIRGCNPYAEKFDFIGGKLRDPATVEVRMTLHCASDRAVERTTFRSQMISRWSC